MFLLSEGTLFFLDLALNSRPCDERPSLSSVVQKWVDEVAAATNSDGSLHDHARTTTGASSTLYAPSPIYPSTTVGQASPTSGGCVFSGDKPQSAPVFSTASFLADEDDAKENETSHCSVDPVSTSGMICGGHCNRVADASRSRRHRDAWRGVKRKIDDTDIISNIESNWDGDIKVDLEETVPPADIDSRIANTTSVSVESPPQKKVRYGDALAASLVGSTEPIRGCAHFMAQLQALHRPQAKNEENATEMIKTPSEYTTRDLPVPCDQRWSQSFLSTAILWYSAQKNIWNVPNVDLTSALQHIFNVVYPDIKYRVTPAGSVFVLTLQRIHEWWSSFGSSALAMMLHFFSSLDSMDDVHAASEFLATDFRFLRADPDSSEPTEPFRSPFLLMLLAITHLGDITAFVDVAEWDMRAMAAGEGGEGVIAIASAALERALTLFRNGTLDVDHVLAETARLPDGPLPETVLDTLVPPALRFSSANWSSHTAAYQEAVGKRGVAFVRETFAAAQAKRRRIAGGKDGESDVGACMSVSGVPDPRALL